MEFSVGDRAYTGGLVPPHYFKLGGVLSRLDTKIFGRRGDTYVFEDNAEDEKKRITLAANVFIGGILEQHRRKLGAIPVSLTAHQVIWPWRINEVTVEPITLELPYATEAEMTDIPVIVKSAAMELAERIEENT